MSAPLSLRFVVLGKKGKLEFFADTVSLFLDTNGNSWTEISFQYTDIGEVVSLNIEIVFPEKMNFISPTIIATYVFSSIHYLRIR